MPRAFSSGALSIESKLRNLFFGLCLASTFVIAAVNVVLPWSMCPIVPMFTCGFVRSYFAFAMVRLLAFRALAGPGPRHRLARHLRHDLVGDGGRHFLVPGKLHRVGRAALGHRPHLRRVAEHLAEVHAGADDLRAPPRLHRDDPPPTAVEVADDGAH